VLDDDEAIFGVLEDGDEETADETEDEDVALHKRAPMRSQIVCCHCAAALIMAHRRPEQGR
jgi:hypothetical protein